MYLLKKSFISKVKDLIVEIVGLIVGLKSLIKKCDSKDKDILKDYCEI